MPVVDVFGARKAQEAIEETWGHLQPRYYKWYRGWIVFTWTAWGQTALIDAEFHDLDSSPWLYEDMQSFLDGWLSDSIDAINRGEREQAPIREGNVYRWDGRYRRLKNSHEFEGDLTLIPLKGK